MTTTVTVKAPFYYPASTPLAVGASVSLPDDLADQLVSAGKAAYATPRASDKQDLTDAERAWVKQSAVTGDGILAAQKGPLSLALAPSADVPTITYPNSTGYGASAIDWSDSRFTYWGGANFVARPSGFGQMASMSTSSFVGPQPYFQEFGYDGAVLVFRAGIETGKTKWLLWVDGRLAATSTTPYSGTVGTQDITLTFGAARPRIITILSTWGAHKITPEADTRTIWKVTRNKGRCLGMLLDSWGLGEGDAFDGFALQYALQMGFSGFVLSAQGGTGYLATGTGGQGRTKYRDRLTTELLPCSPTDWLVHGSINDLPAALTGSTRAELSAERRLLFNAIKATGASADRIKVVGTQFVRPDGTNQAAYVAQDAELAADLAACGLSAPISSSGWLTGTGQAGATTGNGNRDIYRDTSAYGLDHLSVGGHAYWAQRVMRAVGA